MSRSPSGGKDPLGIDPYDFVGGVTPFDADYERPNQNFRCGRERLWRKRCQRGPSVNGACRGTTECTPALRGGRYECRRRAAAGGPCSDGPLPDGRCSHSHPPCAPRRTMRAMRSRLTFVVSLLTIALIVAFLGLAPDSSARLSSISPGPLTGAHSNFTSAKGCVACHEPHGSGAASWLEAAFVPRPEGISENCLECHKFDGEPLAPHNMAALTIKASSSAMTDLTCTNCHTEHKGIDADIRGLSDAQCNTCHQKKFASFADGHPAFKPNYPHDQKSSVWFDHASHFGKHFIDDKYVERAPKMCSACHQVQNADLRVEPSSFEQSCASCHADNIPARELVLWTWPEILDNEIDQEEVVDLCGPTRDQFEAMRDRLATLEAGDLPDEPEEEEFYGVSLDYLSPFAAFILGVPSDDVDEYGGPVQSLALEVLEDGIQPLAERIDDLAGKPVSEDMFARLSPEVVKGAFCAWAANTEYESPADPEFGGWYADGVGIRYKPAKHAGVVPKAWIEFALAAPQLAAAQGADEDEIERAEIFRDSIIERDGGVGACTKCHSVHAVPAETPEMAAAIDAETEGGEAEEPDAEADAEAPAEDGLEVLDVAWQFRQADVRPFVHYSHAPHLNLLGRDMGCKNCHVLDYEADYAGKMKSFDPLDFVSNFKPIQKETCTECHREGGVRQDCQLCHDYHLNPGFKLEIASHEEDAS
ncbi:MAG: hypothetical protein CMM50_06765 [Rhodospirillaceae bacterium]|nr:hypothetical protein [Rhodospirillaceae bacterium]